MLVREKPILDDAALPSGNGVAALTGLRLEALTGQARFGDAARGALVSFSGALRARPASLPTLLLALDWLHDMPLEVIVVLPEEGRDAGPLLSVLRRTYRPNRVVAIAREGAALDAAAKVVPLLAEKRARGGRATGYVCENRTCRFPTADPAELERQLRAVTPLAPAKAR